MKKTVISSAIAALLAGPAAFAQTTTLDQVARELAEIRAKNERLEAEVEYLKENAKGMRKENAVEAVDVANLKTATSKFTWGGDFRFRDEQIKTAPNNTADDFTRNRDRIRLRLGVTAKINDTITGRFQIATAGGATADPRSTNQTLGEDWSRKSVGVDLAYVDWKPNDTFNLTLGKMPQPWTKTASYFWDGDITPEGAAAKLTFGNVFVGAYYDWLNERHSASATGSRSDTKLVGAQVGLKQPLGKTMLTVVGGYFDITNIEDQQVSANAGTCTAYNGTFFANASNGNSTYAFGGCTLLQSDFAMINALAQLDFTVGAFPMAVFVDYMQNSNAEANATTGEKLDSAMAVGVTFNKASAPKSWEVSVVYQKAEADGVFGQFHDSDFGDGKTDTSGFALKGAYAPAANWTVSGTLFINELNNDLGSATTTDLDYKRLQLDLNYKF